MADARFYDYHGPFSLGELAHAVGASHNASADPAFIVSDVVGASDASANSLSYLTTPFAAEGVDLHAAGAWLTTPRTADKLGLGAVPTLLHDNPVAAFAEITHRFYPLAGRNGGAGTIAAVDPTARIGEGVTIEVGAVVGPGAEIGDGSHLAAYAVIGRGVCLGRNCYVGPHASILYALLGDRVTIFAGARIGGDGFGFAPAPKGLVKVPQIGRVILQDDVEIGANAMVDRGALGDTVIGEGTKLDNAVQVGHNCTIGRYVVIAAQVGLSGSVTIGDGVMMGGQIGVGNHLTIGPGARVAAQSGVGKDLPGGQAYGGTPARPAMQWKREMAMMTRLLEGKQTKTDE